MKEETKEEEKKETFTSYFVMIILAVVIAFFIKQFIFNANIVVGESMSPTLAPRDRLITLVFPLRYKDPERGDIIILDAPDGSGREYIKRIVGTPGDEIEIKDGNVYVNDKKIDENYIQKGVMTQIYFESYWKIPDNQFFVMGDNRLPNKSSDSREFGPIERKTIRGIVKLRFWPISKFGLIGGLNDE